MFILLSCIQKAFSYTRDTTQQKQEEEQIISEWILIRKKNWAKEILYFCCCVEKYGHSRKNDIVIDDMNARLRGDCELMRAPTAEQPIRIKWAADFFFFTWNQTTRREREPKCINSVRYDRWKNSRLDESKSTFMCLVTIKLRLLQ